MNFSNKVKFEFFTLLILLSIILRLQVVSNEIGADSFMVHMAANSISEFGYAKWVLHPLSFFGMYAFSEVSALPFFLSAIFQSTGIEMRSVIFLFNILLGILGIFTIYVLASAISNDDLFRFLAAFAFSIAPAILDLTTWTLTARGLFVVLAPLLVYMSLKWREYIRFIPLAIFFAMFLFATHHMVYFIIPVFFAFLILLVLFRFKDYLRLVKIPESLSPTIPIAGFIVMFSIPFFGRKFIEMSVYYPVYEDYVRYIGVLIIPAVGGLTYLVLKYNKSFMEWFLLLTAIFLTALIYEVTYMKNFLQVFGVLFASFGLVNILRSKQKMYAKAAFLVFLLIAISFSAYYQFLHFSPTGKINERYIEDSTYTAGRWMKDYVTGSAISNDMYFGYRIAAAAETIHFLVPYTILDSTYGFITANLSQFKFFPVKSEEFWFNVGESQTEYGEDTWDYLNTLYLKPYNFNITYFAENTKAGGDVVWHHGRHPSKLLHQAYNDGHLVYDGGKVRVWELG